MYLALWGRNIISEDEHLISFAEMIVMGIGMCDVVFLLTANFYGVNKHKQTQDVITCST